MWAYGTENGNKSKSSAKFIKGQEKSLTSQKHDRKWDLHGLFGGNVSCEDIRRPPRKQQSCLLPLLVLDVDSIFAKCCL